MTNQTLLHVLFFSRPIQRMVYPWDYLPSGSATVQQLIHVMAQLDITNEQLFIEKFPFWEIC